MKKLYTVLAAAALGLTAASAAPLRTVDNISPRAIDAPLFQLSTPGTLTIDATFELRELRKAKGMAKAPAQEDILGEYDCTYAGVLNNQQASYSGVANMYIDDYGDIALDVPGSTFPYGYWAIYEDGVLTLPSGTYMNLGGGVYIYQLAYDETGAQVQQISATYDEDAKSFIYPEGSRITFAQVQGSSINGYYTAAKSLTLVRPAGDYSFSITSDSDCNDANKFVFTVTSGADIAAVKLLAFEGDFAASDAQEYGLFDAGGVAVSPNSTIPLDLSDSEETTPFCVLGAAYDADGNLVRLAQKMVDVIVHDPTKWQTITTEFTYTDEIIKNIYNFTHSTTCELQENIEQPGRYRIVNPYRGHSWLHDDDCNHYLTITTDGDQALVEYSPIGIDAGDGIVTFSALNYGTYTGRSIDFPAGSIAMREPLYNQPNKWSYGNQNNAVTFTLPDLELELTALGKDSKPVAGIQFYLASDALAQAPARADEDANVATTDENGKATLVLPAIVDYLDTVTITAKNDKGECNQDIQLAGAKNAVNFSVEAITTTGIDNVSVDVTAPVEYYNLQGMRIDTPVAGQTVIRRQGSVTSKYIVK